LDLTEAEGIADIIDAETQMQRVQALKQMGGALSSLTQSWREKLLRILAHLEADIDFPDEDLPPHIVGQRIAQLTELNNEITAHLSDNRRGERLRDGFSIAVLGAPNAGKSSLINALAQRDAAIVSARAGTTRDIIEVHLDVAGYPIILADTAGLRDTSDEIEGEGIKRALQRASEADLNIVLFDASTPPDTQSLALLNDKSFAVINKTDMAGSIPLPLREGLGEGYKNVLHISAKTGTGIAELLAAIAARLKDMLENQVAAPLTRARHREALTHCQQHLQRALDAYHGNKAPELVGEDIRLATRALARITGVVDVDDILDIIFREFCIGK
ncbi:MAG: tRNA uridine-5-carboxymethylaminomethyl(34) synthesis GTPase MnmE, partial [Alphaproteobacteria bacterium]|nr:tRNA uridine-5-carboxymethylaminomethyl(34) synthesis GTPase MnmE [Alphaproteobacteria bacterium]